MKRSTTPEMLDLLRPPLHRLHRIHRSLRWFNARLGGVRAIRRRLEEYARRWHGPVRILDVATGAADIPRALVLWARSRGVRLDVTGLDLEGDTLALARDDTRGFPEITLVQGDVRKLPFAPGSFDYVICNLFFHHLGEGAAVEALRSFDRIARRGIIVGDLVRRRRSLAWAWLLTRFRDDYVRFDGPQSVRRSFTVDEMRDLVHAAGLAYVTVRPAFAHRWVLAGEKDAYSSHPPPRDL